MTLRVVSTDGHLRGLWHPWNEDTRHRNRRGPINNHTQARGRKRPDFHNQTTQQTHNTHRCKDVSWETSRTDGPRLGVPTRRMPQVCVPRKRSCRQSWRPANFKVDKIPRIIWHSQSPSGAFMQLARGVPHTGALLKPSKHNLCHKVCTAKLVGSRDNKDISSQPTELRTSGVCTAKQANTNKFVHFISRSNAQTTKHPGPEQQDGRGT